MKNSNFLLLIFAWVCISLTACQTHSDENPKDGCIKTIVLVRHAEKIITNETKDPDLTEDGFERVNQLTELFKDWPVDVFLSTDYQRCTKTIAPLANINQQDIEIYEEDELVELAERIKSSDACSFMVVGHSDTNPYLMNHIIGEEKYERIDVDDYSGIFIIAISPDSIMDTKVIRY